MRRLLVPVVLLLAGCASKPVPDPVYAPGLAGTVPPVTLAPPTSETGAKANLIAAQAAPATAAPPTHRTVSMAPRVGSTFTLNVAPECASICPGSPVGSVVTIPPVEWVNARTEYVAKWADAHGMTLPGAARQVPAILYPKVEYCPSKLWVWAAFVPGVGSWGCAASIAASAGRLVVSLADPTRIRNLVIWELCNDRLFWQSRNYTLGDSATVGQCYSDTFAAQF